MQAADGFERRLTLPLLGSSARTTHELSFSSAAARELVAGGVSRHIYRLSTCANSFKNNVSADTRQSHNSQLTRDRRKLSVAVDAFSTYMK